MLDPFIVVPDARPIPLGSSGMTQASGVPKWGAGMGHVQSSRSAICTLGRPSTEAGAEAPYVRWGVPAHKQAAEAPKAGQTEHEVVAARGAGSGRGLSSSRA